MNPDLPSSSTPSPLLLDSASSGSETNLQRRDFLKALTTPVLLALLPAAALATDQAIITKAIPATGERIPVIGMGTWITFNVGSDVAARNLRTEVLKTFLDLGGRMVDSSPMYGSAEEVMGYALKQLTQKQGAKVRDSLFATTKVWTPFDGDKQINDSYRLWGVDKFELFQIHNLVNWQDHLEKLLALKKAGKIRYVGITTSHGRRHAELEQIMKTQPIDFVQLTYNVEDREAEQRLLPVALEKGIAVIVNRPFQGGYLFDRFANKPLPNWASEIDCNNWAQFFLKFVVSHPAITCAIPATSQVSHMKQNMAAGRGHLPDQAMRAKMLAHIQSL
jgi:diketogulonate reductase-like aldo/keto reductase